MKPEGPVGFELRINGRKAVRAVLPAEGVLVFQVALLRGIIGEPADKTVSIEGGDPYGTDTTGARFMRWAKLPIAVGDKVVVRFVTGGKSSPRPRVFNIDGVETGLGLAERLRGLKREVAEVNRKLALSDAARQEQGSREMKRLRQGFRRKLRVIKGKRRRTRGR
jgi:hypothetical protein